mgnify:CR=1 FL=1
MAIIEKFGPLLGRILLALLFIPAGYNKIGGFSGLMLAAAGTLAAVAVALGAFFALAFDAAFAAFHAIFFEAGTWTFGPDSNLLRFFPQPFWFELALVAGATIVLGALVVALLARRDLGAAPAA